MRLKMITLIIFSLTLDKTFGNLNSKFQEMNQKTDVMLGKDDQLNDGTSHEFFQFYGIQLNKLIIREKIFNEVVFNRRKHNGRLAFNFSSQLLNIIHMLRLDSIKVTIRKFAERNSKLTVKANVLKESTLMRDIICDKVRSFFSKKISR